jgi:hypothetical protein
MYFVDGFWNKRPAADWMFSLAYAENANWAGSLMASECWSAGGSNRNLPSRTQRQVIRMIPLNFFIP